MNYTKSQDYQQVCKLKITCTFRSEVVGQTNSEILRSEEKEFPLDTPESFALHTYIHNWFYWLSESDSWVNQDFTNTVSEIRVCDSAHSEIIEWKVGVGIRQRFLRWLKLYHPISLEISVHEGTLTLEKILVLSAILKVDGVPKND